MTTGILAVIFLVYYLNYHLIKGKKIISIFKNKINYSQDNVVCIKVHNLMHRSQLVQSLLKAYV